MALTLSTAAKNARLDALVDRIDLGTGTATGILEIRTSGGTTLLGTLTFANPAFPSASSGTVSANTITQDSSADATGTAALFIVKDRDGTEVFRGTITATGGGGDMELNTTSIVSGGPIQVSSFTLTEP